MANNSERDKVGYGHPPKHHQFKKGESGNPRGRPKSTPSFKADLGAELNEEFAFTENGEERKMTKQRAFIKSLTDAAINKDMRATNSLLAFMRHFGIGAEEDEIEPVDVADLDLLEQYLEQERKKQKRLNASAVTDSTKAVSSIK